MDTKLTTEYIELDSTLFDGSLREVLDSIQLLIAKYGEESTLELNNEEDETYENYDIIVLSLNFPRPETPKETANRLDRERSLLKAYHIELFTLKEKYHDVLSLSPSTNITI